MKDSQHAVYGETTIAAACVACGGPLPSARHKVTCGRRECENKRRKLRRAEARAALRCPVCGSPLPPKHRVVCGAPECWRRYRKANRKIENHDFGTYVVAMVRALCKRVGAGDVAEIGALFEVMRASDTAITEAITGLKSAGYSWTDIGAEAAMSKQAISQWHKRRWPRDAADALGKAAD